MTTHNGFADMHSRRGILDDVQSIRQHARQRIEDSRADPTSSSDHDAALHRLNESLTTQLVGALRYRRGLLVASIKRELVFLAQQEQQPANHAIVRMVQPGEESTFVPEVINGRCHPDAEGGIPLERMIREDLAAERIAIACYREMIGYLQGRSHATRRLLEGVLAIEEEHAAELARMLDDLQRLAKGGAKYVAQPRRSASARPATA